MSGHDTDPLGGWVVAWRPRVRWVRRPDDHRCSTPATRRMSAQDHGLIVVCGVCHQPWELRFDGRGVMVWQRLTWRDKPFTRRRASRARRLLRRSLRSSRS